MTFLHRFFVLGVLPKKEFYISTGAVDFFTWFKQEQQKGTLQIYFQR